MEKVSMCWKIAFWTMLFVAAVALYFWGAAAFPKDPLKTFLCFPIGFLLDVLCGVLIAREIVRRRDERERAA